MASEIIEQPKLKIKRDSIEDESGNLVCFLPEERDYTITAILENSTDMYNAITEFITDIDSGSFQKKKIYTTFRAILNRIDR